MKKEILEIINKNDLGKVLSIDTVAEGVLNENYIILTNKGKFFLKKYKNKSPDEIKYVAEIEKFMENQSVRVVRAIVVDEINKWMLYRYVESDRSHSYSLEDYYLMGKELADIHKASYKLQVPEFIKSNFYKDERDLNDCLNRMKKYLNQIKQKEIIDENDKLFIKYLEKKLFYTQKINNIRKVDNDTIIHGDFHAGNLLIEKYSRKIIGICDWEKAQYAPRAYDLARAYLYIGFGTNTFDVDECLSIANTVLSGYRIVLEISDEELNQGIMMRLKNNVFTTWIEDRYYINNDLKANKFIKNSMLILDYFMGAR